MNKEAIKIRDHFGSVAALARALNIHRSSIYKWNKVPKLRAYQLKKMLDNNMTLLDILNARFTDIV